MDDLTQTFIQESEELLTQMEDALLALEDEPGDEEQINSLFRAMHTIKGAAGIFGFDPVVDFTHPVETVLDQVRSGGRALDDELAGLLLQCKDHTAALVEQITGVGEIEATLLADGYTLLEQLTGQVQAPAVAADAAQEGVVEQEPVGPPHWLITLKFHPDALRNGIDPVSFIRYLGNLGDVVDLILHHDQLPGSDAFDPESCYLGFDIIFHSDASKQEIQAVFEFAEDDCDIRILPPAEIECAFEQMMDELPDDHTQRLGEMLLAVGAITEHELTGSLQQQTEQATAEAEAPVLPVGHILVEQKAVSRELVDKALDKQQKAKQKASHEASLIRVDSAKLGRLINLVGELVISNAAVKLRVEEQGLGELSELVAASEHLVEEIRDNALQLRMVQIGDTFSRFRRVVRDVSRDMEKEIELVITGGDTELDKTVVEKITDPLTHLVRNSLDHGIEMPQERLRAGKPAKGTLSLNAYHDSGHIVIQIRDDGAGLDATRIRAKAEAIGLVKPDQVLTDKEIYQLIFAPGLSTKDKASNLSGRGVGMDVVRRNIDALRGIIDIDSEPGTGTTVTIHLPLTLAIIDGFMVSARGERYIIPLSMVEECVEMEATAWQVDEDRRYVNLRGEVMPYLSLAEFLQIPHCHDDHRRESLVIVRIGHHKAGFVVDTLHGELQTVIKPLGRIFSGFRGISGSTVLGSGEVALILDVQGLIQAATAQMQLH
ncbi:chemotaxis protein CheA [Marinobacterium weihaiense]|uniref:Chemotaxis protein CheA n=1 Tax=Marinobacterium weihaiense TaxID=2851016 RepID=A0ABS6M9K8_9GAMM|nr:chemotaxis protein CheA [Marinobacterium weihaiense]MBV0932967.1 chemotaxis protein CheA [Marinobacterium weihaiense]